MRISLRQVEIEAALACYITEQGISLVGKTLAVEFTSGRKENGLTADIEINDGPVVVPTGAIKENTAQALQAAAAAVVATVGAPMPAVETMEATVVVQAELPPEPAADPEPQEEAKPAIPVTGSLFGN